MTAADLEKLRMEDRRTSNFRMRLGLQPQGNRIHGPLRGRDTRNWHLCLQKLLAGVDEDDTE
eukprot:3739724-Prorocentrum_lima.AAC.1